MRDGDWERIIAAAAAIEDSVERHFDDDRRQQVRGELEGLVAVFDCASPGDLAAYALRRFAEAMLTAIDAEERDSELADFTEAAATHTSSA